MQLPDETLSLQSSDSEPVTAFRGAEPEVEQGSNRGISTEYREKYCRARADHCMEGETPGGNSPFQNATLGYRYRTSGMRLLGVSLGRFDFRCLAWNLYVRYLGAASDRAILAGNLSDSKFCNTTISRLPGPTVWRNCLLRAGYIHCSDCCFVF
jgi:hypothetical protein